MPQILQQNIYKDNKMANNNMLPTILIVGVFGVAGYFIYEKYIKNKPFTPIVNSNTNSNIFQSASNTVSNFLSSISGNQPSNLLSNSGLLNNQGQAQANAILSNPLSFNDLLMQSQTNDLLTGSGLSNSSSGSSDLSGLNSSLMIPYPGVTPGATASFGLGIT